MLNAGGPQAGQHGDSRAVISLVGWTQSFARTRMRPERIGTMASGELGVKLSIFLHGQSDPTLAEGAGKSTFPRAITMQQ
jgi:hypothetical protein